MLPWREYFYHKQKTTEKNILNGFSGQTNLRPEYLIRIFVPSMITFNTITFSVLSISTVGFEKTKCFKETEYSEVFYHAFHHLPFSCGHFAFTALELPVKGRLEERLHPRVHHKQKRQGKYRSFSLTWKAQTTSSLSIVTGMSADISCCYSPFPGNFRDTG